ncbi:MAG TPA: hypothetical protein VKR61_12230 [Bryobacteraceae bacterium]|nr:hypothetical protein [Bryobacteraceae bacterium]
MRVLFVMLCAACCALGQEVKLPPASFTGTVRHIDSATLTLARRDEDDLEISCTHKTHYYAGAKKIKREAIQAGDRVSVETMLDPYRKPEAVNVRVLPPEQP